MAVAHDDTSETPPCGGAQLTPENPNIAGPWPSREAAPASGSAPPGPPFTPFRFYEWLDEFGEANPSLLWAHVTNGWVLSQMLASQRLAAPEPCPYFKKPLIYAFYGRPAYKEKSDDSTRSEPRAPVVILLKPSIEQFAHGVWPFDSGAFHTGRYSTWLAPHMTLDGFSLGDIPGRARRYVTAFFGDNEAYWRMRAKPPSGNHTLRPEVRILCDLLTDASAKPADDRRVVVEMNVDRPIPFTAEFVHSVIVPDLMKDDLDELQLTEKTGIKSIAYEHDAWKPAIEYQALLESIAKAVNHAEKAL